MAKKSGSPPTYRRQKVNSGIDRAFVEIDGRRQYLGRYDTDESRERYRELVAQWATGVDTAPVDDGSITVVELVARYVEHAETYYRRPDGTPTRTVDNVKLALRPLRELFGRTPVAEFGPVKLRAVRQHMITAELSRKTINNRIGKIKTMFRWGVAEEIVPPDVYAKLAALAGLRRGRSAAKEGEPVRPVPPEHVEAIRSFVTAPVWGLVQLQLATGARSGELVIMRRGDIDDSGDVWTYPPSFHKTEHHGHDRMIFIGPHGQEVLRPFLASKGPADFVFSPRDAVEERRQARSARRKTPLSCGNTPGSTRKRKPKRKPREAYTPGTYATAIKRGCEKAGVPHWHPHRLRHSAGTVIRREFDVETARIILGHRSLAMTELYAEADVKRAIEAMREIG